jgi:hypothetical protein
MTTDDTVVQLVTRVPAELRRRVKVHCLMEGRSIMEFVVEALAAKLAERRNGASRRTTRR